MKYLTAEEILIIHAEIIEATGGLHGVRDTGLLLSTAERPRMMFGGKELYRGVYRKAAVYVDSLAKHHMFVDGNKRTAIAAAARFLFVNGVEFQAVNREVEKFVLRVVTEKREVAGIADWLKSHSRKSRV